MLRAIEDLQKAAIDRPKAKPGLVARKARSAPKAPARSIGKRGLSITIEAEDPAYLSLVDVNSYRPALRGWSFDTLTRKITTDMNAGRLVAFGTPEERLRIRLTTGAFRGHSNAIATTWLEVTGELALATYTSITMAADGSCFPDVTDPRFQLPAGKYRVDVHRLFAHEAGAQFAEGKLPKGDHYVITFSPRRPKASKLAWVPWALSQMNSLCTALRC